MTAMFKEPKPVYFSLLVGSQTLYGEQILREVADHSTEIAKTLSESKLLPAPVVFKGVLKAPEEITAACLQATADADCAGVIIWNHTFSPAQMWAEGLENLKKPTLLLHTQYSAEIPWCSIDMDYMNCHQSAHGDREFGHICMRLGLPMEVVVGHWRDTAVIKDIESWMRIGLACKESRGLTVARLGDNMKSVAVTEGDKVAARIAFGWQVKGFGIGELAAFFNGISDDAAKAQVALYSDLYSMPPKEAADVRAIIEQAKLELSMQRFLQEAGAAAVTTTFEDLHGLPQLPGLAAQRLMEIGCGFGAEGDWKTAALLRILKVAGKGRTGGSSFMEAYTYDFNEGLVLGAHMLEVCPSIAASKPRIGVYPLSIGGKNPPARLLFDAQAGKAVDVCLVQAPNGKFRMIANAVECIQLSKETPKLPVAKALWRPLPDFRGATREWLLAGGSHHTVLTYAFNMKELRTLANMLGAEFVAIGG